MNRRLPSHRSITSAVLLLALLLTPANIFPCAVSFPEPVFTQQDSPDQPLDLFAQGRLGIILPSYERQYLVVAYRYLSGKPLTKAEETAVAEAWAPKVFHPGEPSPSVAPVTTWEEARSAALGHRGIAKIDIGRFKWAANGWQMYPSCGDDAFLTAASTVNNLAKDFGVDSPAVRDWVGAQDTVFQNCGGNRHQWISTAHLPKPVGFENAVLNFGRQYQIAAANFYGGDLQTAAQQFQQIAEERESPWRLWAPYLVARCYIREATLDTASGGNPDRDPSQPTFNLQQMTAAEKQLQGILRDPSLATIHPASQKLLNYVEGRLHPDQRLHDVAQQLAGRVPAGEITQDLIDFNWFIRQQARASDGINSPKFNEWRNSLAERGLLDNLTDWVLSFQQQSPDALAHAVERWRATKSEPWLIAALSKAERADSSARALADAAAAITSSSPAYEMAVYYRARLLTEQNQQQAARQLLDANLPRLEKGPLSSFNLLLAQRLAAAADFHQFLEYAPRTPIEYAYTGCDDCGTAPDIAQQSKPLPKRLDGDSAIIFNQRLPLSLLTEAATEPVLPSDLRGYIATATWARAAILGDTNAGKAVEAPMAEAHPDLRDYLKAYDAASSDVARFFAATWTMLHFPGMQPFIYGGAFRDTKFNAIDDYRSNWWCGDEFPTKALPPGTVFYGNGPPIDPATGKQAVPVTVIPPPFPSFLTASERASADDQRSRLSTLAVGPAYMGRVVLDWAKAHPDDQRLPEALHLVVRATRYGCTDNKTGAISKQAFDLLHARYTSSTWAKQTPYWFK
ncbi:MAG: hypothetical protein WAM71_07020 [Candidatus Korobacteraceae bacterium]